MNIIDCQKSAVPTIKGSINKSISKLMFYFSENLGALDAVLMQITILRQGQGKKNIDVTDGFISVAQFLATAMVHRVMLQDNAFTTTALVDLTPQGAFKIDNQDSFVVEFKNMTLGEGYVVDGVEDLHLTTALYRYGAFPIPALNKTYDIDTKMYSALSFTNDETIIEFNETYQGGQLKRTLREMQTLAHNLKPINHITKRGIMDEDTSQYIAIPCGSLEVLNFVKDATTVIQTYGRYLVHA